ncbi:hypothetical protein PFFVO_05652 [Plasmodium falciparum Vietnam Oak-Knoll (FVO)]|nr:hypothetical protein PFFVO_05652 [Plasmodium falciparum Vietnam Oak-Knoll (FVO)]
MNDTFNDQQKDEVIDDATTCTFMDLNNCTYGDNKNNTSEYNKNDKQTNKEQYRPIDYDVEKEIQNSEKSEYFDKYENSFIHQLINDLIHNNLEEENYIQFSNIDNEEIKYRKLKEVITNLKIKEKKIDLILSNNLSFFKYSCMYRKRQLLHEKMLGNWSYVENTINKRDDIRNKNLPFQLLKLEQNMLENISKCYDDILLEDFSGIIITLNTNSFERETDGKIIKVSKVICGCLIEYLDNTSELNIKCIWAHPFLNTKSTYYILCAFLPRVILEAFLNSKGILHNDINDKDHINMVNSVKGEGLENMNSEMCEFKNSEKKKKKKKSFYDRLNELDMEKIKNDHHENDNINNSHNNIIKLEQAYFSNYSTYEYPLTHLLNFNKECAYALNYNENLFKDNENKQDNINTCNNMKGHNNCNDNTSLSSKDSNNKFLYIIFSDIDIFPRQCYLILCSYKYMCLNMHYDTDNYSVHYDLENMKKENVGKTTELSNSCPCKCMKSIPDDSEESYERIIGLSELYMYYMIPKREERENLGLLKRNGWRDLICSTFLEDVHENISSILKIKTHINKVSEHISVQNRIYEKRYTPIYINKYEWCGLKLKDIRNMLNEDFNYDGNDK